ncbi:MAG: nucleoside triphosphate pyrophosphohydrolase [Ruminococcaceae bacterium]|nr:nucleoside triphosphate pyrophosphohydrolase [Oscillospiraceae bacterium]
MENEKISCLLEKEKYDFEDLRTVMKVLRSENGCPWDREQDHHSIRSNLIEETYEVVEAIDTENAALLREELGDLLFQIMFHAELEDEKGSFDIDDVTDEICKKMISRHPHVFGNVEAETTAQVLKNWDAIKTEEKQRLSLGDKLRAIPPMLPSLMRAAKVNKKAKICEDVSTAALRQRLIDEVSALPVEGEDNASRASQMGAILLTAVQLCEKMQVDAEESLQHTTDDLIEKIASNP